MSKSSGAISAVQGTELKQAARGGLVSIVGAGISAVMGFALTFVLARSFGESGSGVVLQTVAVFTIALGLARTGMDTAGVWILPRLVLTDRSKIRGATTALLVPTVIVGMVLALLLYFLTPLVDTSSDGYGRQLVQAIQATSWFLPCGAVVMVALAATRGLGNIVPYTVIGSIGLPALRPILVLGVAAIGGTAVLASVAWAAPAALAMIVALFVLWRRIRAQERVHGIPGGWWPDKDTHAKIWKFSLPRWYSSGIEQSIIWFDVVLVGAIAGASAAGIYGAASRFVSAGLIISTAMRMVVSPQFSALLSEEKTARVQELYTTTVTWIVMLGVPIYGIFMFFSPTVMGWLGPGFEAGAPSLVVLCFGAIAFLIAGNVDALLMMSGRSGWMAFNKSVVLAINIAGNLILVPIWGIMGAAVSWAFSLLLDSLLASVETRIFLGIKFGFGRTAYAFVIAACSVVPISLTVIHFIGRSTLGVFVAGIGAMVILGIWCWLDRRRLRLSELKIFSRKGNKPSNSSNNTPVFD